MTNTNLTRIDLEEIENKLKGLDFFINSMLYMNNTDEDLYMNGVLTLSNNVKTIIMDIARLEDENL